MTPQILFVIKVEDEKLYFSQSAIYSMKETLMIDTGNTVNESGASLEIGDKILANTQQVNNSLQVVIKQILARKQLIGSSDAEYLKMLRIYINDQRHRLDFQELNVVLENSLGIAIRKMTEFPSDYNLILDISDEDPGTTKCPFTLSHWHSSYPLRISFPEVSGETIKYLRKLHPDAKVTETRIFAFRVIHFLLHKLGYFEHFDAQEILDYKMFRKASREGDPLQIPTLDATKVCMCSWESTHFAAVQNDKMQLALEGMTCDGCKRKRKIPTGVVLQDFKAEISELIKSKPSKRSPHLRVEKHIFYVVERRNDGVVLNVSPFKSKTTISGAGEDWIGTIFTLYDDLSNIFIPDKLFNESIKVKRGDKILVRLETASTLSENGIGVSISIKSVQVMGIMRRGVAIINPSSLLSLIKPFRLGITLKTGPDTDMNFISDVRRIISRLTGWHVEIDKSSFETLKSCFSNLNNIQEEWKKATPTERNNLVGKAREIIDALAPRKDEVEDSFRVIVYIFPSKYTFIEDIFGTIAFGEALYRLFAVVRIFPKVPSEYETQEPCKQCLGKPTNPWSEQITALFVIHEVLHIASGLDDHHNCSSCRYGREEMKPFQRFYCEECIRNNNDIAQRNCLMTYECQFCIGTRLSKGNFRDFLCDDCRKKLLPAEQFVAKQAVRMNSLIHANLLEDESQA